MQGNHSRTIADNVKNPVWILDYAVGCIIRKEGDWQFLCQELSTKHYQSNWNPRMFEKQCYVLGLGDL